VNIRVRGFHFFGIFSIFVKKQATNEGNIASSQKRIGLSSFLYGEMHLSMVSFQEKGLDDYQTLGFLKVTTSEP